MEKLTTREQMGITKLLNEIKLQKEILYNSGSCGDGSFDYKSRMMDIDDHNSAIKIIKRITGIQ